jgi:hypothetical protein
MEGSLLDSMGACQVPVSPPLIVCLTPLLSSPPSHSLTSSLPYFAVQLASVIHTTPAAWVVSPRPAPSL